VIATGYLFNTGTALWTITNIPITRSPSIKVIVYDRVTLSPSMLRLTALETECVSTFALYLVRPLLPDESTAVGFRAPSQIRVQVHVNVLLELQVLIEHLLRTEFSDIFTRILSWARLICAFDFIDLTIGNIEFQIVALAVQTEPMSALLYTMHIFL
jgi:hypothetical protein